MAIRINHQTQTATRETDHGPLPMPYADALALLQTGRAREL